MKQVSRRQFSRMMAAFPLATSFAGIESAVSQTQPAGPRRSIARGPFRPSWESLASQYQCPEWFRDAKFGIWSHWGAQCVPEAGDWYAREMYLQGHPSYRHHVRSYGHPTSCGFMEIINLWKAERWEPRRLMDLYKRAGAKYFFALANHHDNFDCYDSKHHGWNSLRVGPKKDIVGTWAEAAREAGLRFGVSNHSAHAWHWFQTAYGYDPEGDRAGERYDAFTLKPSDGQGKWWEGLDPKDLYTAPVFAMPDGIRSIRDANAWHEHNDRVWTEDPPVQNPAFVENWFLRCQDLVDRYRPDALYFDNTGLPLGQAGLNIAAHFYNASTAWHGRNEAVLNGKWLTEAQMPALVDDSERRVADGVRAYPWQTDTCIGNWHYQRSIVERHGYKTAKQVLQMLADIVSKNGNLLLSIPMRGDGTIDEDELAFLDALAQWMPINGEAIFGTRPWTTYGEGPSVPSPASSPTTQANRPLDVRRYTGRDIRYTRKGDTLYALLMEWPGEHAVLTSLTKSDHGEVARVELLTPGGAASLPFAQDASGLRVALPVQPVGEHVPALKISGLRLGD